MQIKGQIVVLLTVVAFAAFARKATMPQLSAPAFAHTDAEKNDMARAMLGRALDFSNDCIPDGGPWVGGGEPPFTWNGFLGRGAVDGWSQQDRKDAFAFYLSTLGTNDCRSLPLRERELVRVALSKCRTFNFVEAAPSLKALALNPNGIYRDHAIELAMQFSPVDDSATAFSETIMTNTTAYTRREYAAASCQYARMLLNFNATNDVQRAIRNRAVNMFYRNRLLPANAYYVVDRLFVQYISGYETSSNRLENVNNLLSLSTCPRISVEYFTSVTNQLLSSGQPLVQLNIGEGE